MGEEHPAFDWDFEHEVVCNRSVTVFFFLSAPGVLRLSSSGREGAQALQEAEKFEGCAADAESVEDGVTCLGQLLTELPEAMVER
eukprot:2802668-Rhodomonas_salina.1